MTIRFLKASPAASGDCYEAAGRYIMDKGHLGEEKGLLLVHGEVQMQVKPWVRYGHAWVEDGDMVIDVSNGRNIQMPKMLYYGLASVHGPLPPYEPNIHVYTVEEAMKKLLQNKHWGPWDLVTSTGL